MTLSEMMVAYVFMRLYSNCMVFKVFVAQYTLWWMFCSHIKTCFRSGLLPKRTVMSWRKVSGHLFHLSVRIKSITALTFSGD